MNGTKGSNNEVEQKTGKVNWEMWKDENTLDNFIIIMQMTEIVTIVGNALLPETREIRKSFGKKTDGFTVIRFLISTWIASAE